MKKLFPFLAVMLLAIMITESCKSHKPPKSTGHKSYKQSKRAR